MTAPRQADPAVWSWSVDSAGRFDSCSAESLSIVGYAPEELLGRPAGLVMDLDEVARANAAMTRAGELGWHRFGFVIAGRRSDGTVTWLELTGSPRHHQLDEVMWASRPLANGSGPSAAVRAVRQRIESILAERLLITAFQPIVDLVSGCVVGAEALTRFVAESSTGPQDWFVDAALVGLGTELELLAVQTALAAATDLPEDLYVSVNASPAACLDGGLARLVADSRIPAGRIVLELTEHSPVLDYSALRRSLGSLRTAGVRIAVDDAGAGYSSFQHVLQINPDVIKLDRSLIAALDTDPARYALGAAMVSFAAEIGAEVVAEGIETRSELRAATTLGMGAGQGFLLGRPSVLPAEWAGWRPGVIQQPWASDAITSDRRPAPVARRALAQRPDRTRPASTALGPDSQGADPAWAGGLAESALNALPDATAVVDHSGTIVAVNRAWELFALDNGGPPETTGVGVNYLEVCTRAAAAGDTDAADVRNGLGSVLAGETVEYEQEYPCNSPEASRWFISRMTSVGAPAGGAVTSHVNITRRKRSELQLAHLAAHDPLTGLANRTLFFVALDAALADAEHNADTDAEHGVGLLYIDLDSFKPVNDTYGHSAGDELLLVVAHRLRSVKRAQDTAARLGGDEFAICVPGASMAGLQALATRVRQALAQPHQLHGCHLQVTGSVGIHLARHGDVAADALRRADQAMYLVKHGKRDRTAAGRTPAWDQPLRALTAEASCGATVNRSPTTP